MPEPQFEGQTKEVLGTPAATRIVQQVVSAGLKDYFENPPRGAKQQARAVLDKIVAAAKTRIAAREHRENQRRKSALASSTLPAKLVDCRSADDRSELFIVEGDSALGTAKLARDSEFQALLPIRGKILNVQKSSAGRHAQERRVRRDHPGHRRGLGQRPSTWTRPATSASSSWPTPTSTARTSGRCCSRCSTATCARMLDAGRVFAAVPPLHRIELTNPGKGQQKHIYTYSDAELRRTLLELESKGKRWKEPQRYKGLGEMDANQLAETTMDPRHRTLRRIRIEDAKAATDVFNLLMGTEVAPRRDFIIGGATELDLSRIDT